MAKMMGKKMWFSRILEYSYNSLIDDGLLYLQKHYGIGILYGNCHLKMLELLKLKSPVLRGISIHLSVVEVTIEAEKGLILCIGDHKMK